MTSKATQQARPSLRYKDVDLPSCRIGGPTDVIPGQTGRQRRKAEQRLLLKFRWPLTSPLTGKGFQQTCGAGDVFISTKRLSSSGFAGPARAGKLGQLLSDAGIYEGDVLAGRPQGFGRYYTGALPWPGCLKSRSIVHACSAFTSTGHDQYDGC